MTMPRTPMKLHCGTSGTSADAFRDVGIFSGVRGCAFVVRMLRHGLGRQGRQGRCRAPARVERCLAGCGDGVDECSHVARGFTSLTSLTSHIRRRLLFLRGFLSEPAFSSRPKKSSQRP